MTNGRTEAFQYLTRREKQVLQALMRGETADEISRSSYVSLTTVRSQIRSILTKLGVSSQLAAVALAYRSGWSAPTGPTAGDMANAADRLAAGM